MDKSRYFPLALEALVELMPEIRAAESEALAYAPTLDEVLENLESPPEGALFLGMAFDGLPVLLNLYDPIPGSILIVGEDETGRTRFLKSLAGVAIRMFDPHNLQFGVLTTSPKEWEGYERFEHCAAILPIYDKSAMDFVQSLNSWAHANRTKQTVLLLLDGLDKVSAWDTSMINAFRWLTMRGPSRRVWPIASLNANLLRSSENLIHEFHTVIFGSVREAHIPPEITQLPTDELKELNPINQFAMKEGNDWLKFWIPRLEAGD